MRWADGGPGGEDPTSLAQGLFELGGGLAQALPDGGFPFGLGGSSSARGRLEFAAAAIPACRAAAPASAAVLDGIAAEVQAFADEVDRTLADMRKRWRERD